MKHALGPLCLLFAAWLLVGVAPTVTCAQDTARPAKSARARRSAAPKPHKKKARVEATGASPQGRKKSGNSEREPAAAPVGTGGESPTPAAPARDKRSKPKNRSETHAGEVIAKSESAHLPAASAAASAAQQSAAGVNAQIVKEGDTSVKVMEFSGLGIEGRLKSPQLVYFTQRVRAEFERPQLPHRSFMPELEASTLREPVR